MTPFKIMISHCGLSQREAADFLDTNPAQIDNWSRGKSRTPPGVIDELIGLADDIRERADAALALSLANAADMIELGFPADDDEARDMGYPCIGAWGAMAGMVMADADLPVRVVPRGSTPASAAAERR